MAQKISALAAVCLFFLWCAPLFAADPFPDFTFRRIKPPKAGADKLITIQVDPVIRVTPGETSTGSLIGPVPQNGRQENWFWDVIGSGIEHAGPGRFGQASKVVGNAPNEFAAPRLQHLRSLADQYGIEILMATVGKNISPAFILAIISTESSGNSQVVSTAGATGLMQLMPDTAMQYGVTDISDPGQNIRAGVGHLEFLLGRFHKDPILALAAYNSGETAIAKHGGVPPFPETRAYVPKVIKAWQVARMLCITPPELFSDGCVFSVKDS